MLAVVAMASCSKSELTPRPEVAGDVEIKAGSTVLSIDTREPYTNNLKSDGQDLVAHVYAAVKPTSGTVDYKATSTINGYMHFKNASGNVAPVGFSKYDGTPAVLKADPKYYPANGDALQMVAVYPAESTPTWSAPTSSSDVITATINGKTDLMAAQVATMDGTDDAINKKNAATQHPKFDFKHLLTLVNVKVKVEVPDGKTAADIVASFGKITDIKLTAVNESNALSTDGVNSEYELALNSFAFQYNTTGATRVLTGVTGGQAKTKTTDGIQFYGLTETGGVKTYSGEPIDNSTYAITLTENAAYAAYAIVAPFTVSTAADDDNKLNMQLVVKTEKGPADGFKAIVKKLKNADASEFTGNTIGKQFDVTLVFKAQEILASAEVAGWGDAVVPTQDVPVE